MFQRLQAAGFLKTSITIEQFLECLQRTVSGTITYVTASDSVADGRLPHEQDGPVDLGAHAVDSLVSLLRAHDTTGEMPPMLPSPEVREPAVGQPVEEGERPAAEQPVEEGGEPAGPGHTPHAAHEDRIALQLGIDESLRDENIALQMLREPAELEQPLEPALRSAAPAARPKLAPKASPRSRVQTRGGLERLPGLTADQANIVYGLGADRLRQWGWLANDDALASEFGRPVTHLWRHPQDESGIGFKPVWRIAAGSPAAAAANARSGRSGCQRTRTRGEFRTWRSLNAGYGARIRRTVNAGYGARGVGATKAHGYGARIRRTDILSGTFFEI